MVSDGEQRDLRFFIISFLAFNL